jgi:hypothetical protein
MTPNIRKYLYTLGVVVFAALTVLSTFKIIDPNTAESVSAALTSVLGLFGVTVAGTAAYNTQKQIKKGTFDQVSPADMVIQGINDVVAQAESAQSDVERVKDAVSSVVRDIPILGPLAQQALNSLPKL